MSARIMNKDIVTHYSFPVVYYNWIPIKLYLAGFPQALENLEITKKVPCMEKAWKLKKT